MESFINIYGINKKTTVFDYANTNEKVCRHKESEKGECMSEREFEETVINLMKMDIDTYLEYKYMILSEASIHSSSGVVKIFEKLFSITDRNRPLLIEMKTT